MAPGIWHTAETNTAAKLRSSLQGSGGFHVFFLILERFRVLGCFGRTVRSTDQHAFHCCPRSTTLAGMSLLVALAVSRLSSFVVVAVIRPLLLLCVPLFLFRIVCYVVFVFSCRVVVVLLLLRLSGRLLFLLLCVVCSDRF